MIYILLLYYSIDLICANRADIVTILNIDVLNPFSYNEVRYILVHTKCFGFCFFHIRFLINYLFITPFNYKKYKFYLYLSITSISILYISIF